MRKQFFLATLATAAMLCGCSGDPLSSGEYTVELKKGDDQDHAESEGGIGTAWINVETGNVAILVENMPQLSNEAFEGWLAGGGEDPVSTGIISIDAAGVGFSEIELGNLSSATFDDVVITVEPQPDADPEPTCTHSISGTIEGKPES